MRVFKYKVFSNTSEFEQWQYKNTNLDFFQFTPVISGLNMEQTTLNELEAKTAPVSLFVLYAEKPTPTGKE